MQNILNSENMSSRRIIIEQIRPGLFFGDKAKFNAKTDHHYVNDLRLSECNGECSLKAWPGRTIPSHVLSNVKLLQAAINCSMPDANLV